MRIPIREQLGLLVLLTSLIALAVIAIATVRQASSLRMGPNPNLVLVGEQLQLRRGYQVPSAVFRPLVFFH